VPPPSPTPPTSPRLRQIREVVETYPYVAMDTEFPGVVARPIGDFGSSDYQYQTLRCNVDLLKIIQLGLSFANEDGEFAPGCCCWQFNFKFSLGEDMYAQDSIDLLKMSGIDFGAHEARGIDVRDFGELLMSSGLVLLDSVVWVSFHRCAAGAAVLAPSCICLLETDCLANVCAGRFAVRAASTILLQALGHAVYKT
jgi:CAF1 family ribonuclease